MEENNIKKVKLCSGCGACKNICPVNAISIEFNKKGFYSPIINKEKCINCGKCLKICPAVQYKSKNKNTLKSFVVSASDEERRNSASGAFFPILAKWVLKNDGYVCGAAWDDEWNVNHIIINKLEDLPKLRYSKYVQSNTHNCFKEIKELLDNGNYVLFSGTPCQNAGLNLFLGKDYDKLITIDLLCHGVPSPKVWQNYLKENFDTKNINDINFRSKQKGWISTKDSYYDTECAYIKIGENKTPIGIYYEAFLNNILSNDACMECKYKSIPRPADFTCGDFWRYSKYGKNLNDGKGLSIVLINNKKAQHYLELVKNDLKLCKQIRLKKLRHIEITNKSKATKARILFFDKFQKEQIPTTKLIQAALNKHYDIGLLSFFNGLNYGSALVAYATNTIIESLGYSVLNIHKQVSNHYNYDSRHLPYQFAKDNYFISKEYKMAEKNDELNDLCNGFVLGSDTLWWWQDVKYTDNFFWLDFVNSQNKKIAFCTSFGFDEPNIPPQKQKELKYLYNRFDYLSTREDSGVDILKNYFGCKSESLCDPTFIAEKSVFEDLAKKSERKDKNYIAAYILDINKDKKKALEAFAKKMNLPLILIPNMHKSYQNEKKKFKKINIPIQDFVYLIKNANFVITDSFHGACFSVIFEKEFAAIVNQERGNARYKIFKEMGLNLHFIPSFEALYNLSFNNTTDFSKARKIIEEKRQKGLQWLGNALTKPKTSPENPDLFDNYLYLLKHKQKRKEYYLKRSKNIKYLFWKYRILENFVLGKTKDYYHTKKLKYKQILIDIGKL